jgi:hypothetical protein
MVQFRHRYGCPRACPELAEGARSGNGVFALFRNKSHATEANMQLPLLPVGGYKLRSMISGKELGFVSHSEWIRDVRVKFPDAEPVEILEVIAISG